MGPYSGIDGVPEFLLAWFHAEFLARVISPVIKEDMHGSAMK